MAEDARECTLCKVTQSTDSFVYERTECKQCVKLAAVIPQQCLECHKEPPEVDFRYCNFARKYRTKCKACSKVKPVRSREEAIMPTECSDCGKGPDEVKFPFRTDTGGTFRNRCQACHNSDRRWVPGRERKREEDLEGFRAHNAKILLEWRHKNPENCKKHREPARIIPDKKIRVIASQAKNKNRCFEHEKVDKMKAKLSEPCHYCGFEIKEGDVLNGLDRVDNSLGYTDSNTVSSCFTCNNMKFIYDINDFIFKIRKIYSKHPDECALTLEPRVRRTPSSVEGKLRGCPKSKNDHLTSKEKALLKQSECYLCGTRQSIGIDRVDSDGDYIKSNCEACCTTCNYTKRDLPLEMFYGHVGIIYSYTESWKLDMTDNQRILESEYFDHGPSGSK